MELDKNYKNLTKHIRQLEVEELKTGKYPHLRNPNKKVPLPPFQKYHFVQEQFKPSYLFRPTSSLGNGNRNLTVSRTEFMIEYHGEPMSNYLDGFILDRQRPVRVIVGDYLFSEIRTEFRKQQENLETLALLERGNYPEFVQRTLRKTNHLIDWYKDFFRNNPRAVKF